MLFSTCAQLFYPKNSDSGTHDQKVNKYGGAYDQNVRKYGSAYD